MDEMATLERTPHVRQCLLCKELLDACAAADEDYAGRALAVIRAHVGSGPGPESVACAFSGCIKHERVGLALARALVRVGGGDRPWINARGHRVASMPLLASEDDHPVGFDMTRQDAVHRHFVHLAPSAGDVFVRLNRASGSIHLWIAPAYVSRREDVTDPPTIEDIVETHEKRVPALKSWCLAKYADLRALAFLDLELGRSRRR